MESIETIFDLAKCAYRRGDFVSAKIMLDKVIEVSPRSICGFGARYLRARGFEDGYFGAADLDSALSDYSFLLNNEECWRGDALLGRARVLFSINANSNIKEVIWLCMSAIDEDHPSEAMIFLGSIYESYFNDYSFANKFYISAFCGGNALGLRYYARLKMKNKNYICGISAHFATTIVAPFFYLFRRK